jgi:hypothetical protein
MLKYERYFFKEDKEMSKTCKDGYRWCPIKKKCMPPDYFKGKGQRQHRGQGEGPMGMPNAMKEANDLVDIALDEGFEVFGKLVAAEKELERLLDHCGKCGKPRIDECGVMDEVESEEYEDDYNAAPNVGPNDIDHVPNQDTGTLYGSIRKQLGEIRSLSEEGKEKYKEYFKTMLARWGASSPEDLGDYKKKKEFFDAVDKGWKAKKETD